MRPAGADLGSSAANRVLPVAPVNPSVTSSVQEPGPSVINLVNPALKPNQGEPVYTSVQDPIKRNADLAPKDWTIHRPAPEKQPDPPPKPISKVLMDHLRTVWTASASAIQIEQVKDQLTPPPQPSATQAAGELAKEAITYSPNKIKKTENL